MRVCCGQGAVIKVSAARTAGESVSQVSQSGKIYLRGAQAQAAAAEQSRMRAKEAECLHRNERNGWPRGIE